MDVLRLKQIIMNLGKNSTKFVYTGFVRLVARRISKTEIELSVEDSGPGIPKDQISRVFSRYEQLDRHTQGTGLGLSLCSQLAGQMGGRLMFCLCLCVSVL